MSSTGLEVLGVAMAALGWIFATVSCALPMWSVSAYIGANINTPRYWEGLWMRCVAQNTCQMVCRIHDSMMALTADVKAACALAVFSVVVASLGILVAVMGSKCTNCVEEESAKAQMMRAAGVAFILASLTQLIPVSWYAHHIVTEFSDPAIIEEKKREIGAALYVGWAAAIFLLIGGGVLCRTSAPQAEKSHRPPPNIRCSQTRSNVSSDYNRKDYV